MTTPSNRSPATLAKRVMWRYVVGVLVALLLSFAFWPSLISKATSSDFLAHRYCYSNNPQLVWTNVVSDCVIALSYLAISATLALLVHRARRDIPFSWVFLAFGLFIVACGCTHLMEAVTVWVPLYWLSADVKIVTAAASLATAISLPMLVPKTISLFAASKLADERKLQLEAANAQLLRLTQDATARLAAIVEGSGDAIIAYTLDGVITDWNQAATQLYGYSAEGAIGHNVSFLELAIHPNEYHEILKTIAAGGRFQQIEGLRLRKDGSPVAVLFSIFPIRGNDGAIIGGSCIVHDITSRKRMEEELRRSEERFRLVALATNDSLSDRDLRNETMWRSDNYWEHFGYSRKEQEPDVSAWRELIHPEDRDRVVHGFQTSLARHADSHEVEYRFRRADDSYAIVLERTYVIYGESGEPIRALSAMTDLSDRRDLEAQFRQAQKMEAVGRLAGGVAHDFNNILMVISAYTELIHTRSSSDSELQNNVAQVLNATKKAAALTYQLLAFSRKQVLVPHIIDLNIVVEDTSKMIQRVIGEDIELNVSLSEALWRVKVDPGQIVQVLMNLCVNARDAMCDGGELRIETKNVTVDVEAANRHPTLVPGDYVVLVVSDNGTGMTKEVQSHLFDPFFTTKELGQGTGLGLSTVYGIVKQSGGYVWVDSEIGRGSTFTVYFPVIDAPLTRKTVTPAIVCTGGKGEIILLVEDDDGLRESISTYLDLNGYKVLAAANGAEGIAIAQQHAESIRVLVTDVVLPKLSGEKLAQEVAKISPHVLTLFISGYTDRRMVDFDPESSTVAFLQKPFALRTLVEKIAEMTARQK